MTVTDLIEYLQRFDGDHCIVELEMYKHGECELVIKEGERPHEEVAIIKVPNGAGK